MDCTKVEGEAKKIADARRALQYYPKTEKIQAYEAELSQKEEALAPSADICADKIMAKYGWSTSSSEGQAKEAGISTALPVGTNPQHKELSNSAPQTKQLAMADKGPLMQQPSTADSDVHSLAVNPVSTTPGDIKTVAAATPVPVKAKKVVSNSSSNSPPKSENDPASPNNQMVSGQSPAFVSKFNPGDFYLMTGVGAVLAGAESTSYKTTNDVLYAQNVGRKTPELLAGVGFPLPWRRGGYRYTNRYGCSLDNNGKPILAKGCDPDYSDYRPWHLFVSLRLSPTSDQTLSGFTIGGGYKITKYFSLLTGYAVSPVEEPAFGLRVAASQVVAANSTITPYNHYNPTALLNNSPTAFDGFPLFVQSAAGPTTTRIYPGTSPTVTHYRSGIFFGIGVPFDLKKLFPSSNGNEVTSPSGNSPSQNSNSQAELNSQNQKSQH